MKEIINKLFAFLVVTTLLASCLKEGNTNIDVNNPTAPVVALQWIENGSGSTINAGMQYFSGGALSYSASHKADTASYNVALAGSALASDVTVTVGVDATKILDNFKSDAVSYELMPDSLYKLLGTTATIKAGSNVAGLQIVFYPSKIDPTRSYNLPLVIKDAQGKIISGNFGVIYFHTIGNPLAGVYNVVGTRYNYNGVIGYTGGAIPTGYAGTAASPNPKTASPSSPTVILLDYANLGGNGYHYVITYDKANPTVLKVTGDFLSAVSNFAVLVNTYDPVLKKIHILSTYNNAAGGSGSDRIIDETFTHQ